MTTQEANPSNERTSTTTTPMSNTPISRMLYLRSNQADANYGPSHKRWIVSPMWTKGKYHNLVVRSLQILHLFPNVRETVTLKTGSQTVTIPAGNYQPAMIARYLNDQLYPNVQSVCWDPDAAAFRFCPGIDIEPTSTAAPLLGFEKGVSYKGVTESVLPANIYGPQRIIVDTNLQLFNIPVSGRLAVIPILEKYGQIIHYNNFSSTYSHLCMEQDIQFIEIKLMDENGAPLHASDSTPWDILISFEPIDNPGFQGWAKSYFPPK